MSISVEFSTPEQGNTVLLPQITPGEVITISDYSQDNRDVIAITCYSEDDGGEVHVFSNEDFPENDRLRIIYPENLHAENRLAIIPAGGKFERDIVTSARKKGHLVLRHMLGNPHISSLDS